MDTITESMITDHIALEADKPMLPQIAMKHKEYMPMPFIGTQDPVARWIGAKPGDVVEIIREVRGGRCDPLLPILCSECIIIRRMGLTSSREGLENQKCYGEPIDIASGQFLDLERMKAIFYENMNAGGCGQNDMECVA